jgi:hypothetical protein
MSSAPQPGARANKSKEQKCRTYPRVAVRLFRYNRSRQSRQGGAAYRAIGEVEDDAVIEVELSSDLARGNGRA